MSLSKAPAMNRIAMKIYVKLEAPFEWARVSGAVSGTRVEAFGEVQALKEYPIGDDEEVVGVVPGEWVTTHRVNLPTRTRKQFNQALPFALEDAISEDVGNIHFVCPDWKAATEVSVMAIAKSKMQEWQQLANDNRLPIEQLVPDYHLVPFHDVATCSIAKNGESVFAMHTDLGGVTIDEDLLDVWLMEVPMADTLAVNDESLTKLLIEQHPNRDFRHWDFGDKMRHWLEYDAETALDLWTDQYRPKISRMGKRPFLKPIALAVCALLLVGVYDTYRYFSLHSEIGQLDQKMVRTLQQAVPGVEGVSGGEARGFLERAINRGQAKSNEQSVHSMLANIGQVMRRMQATLMEMSYQNETMTLTCVLNDFSQVDALVKQFNARKSLTASLQGSSAEDGKVIATYTVRFGQ